MSLNIIKSKRKRTDNGLFVRNNDEKLAEPKGNSEWFVIVRNEQKQLRKQCLILLQILSFDNNCTQGWRPFTELSSVEAGVFVQKWNIS